MNAIGGTRNLLTDLKQFNKDHWTVRYPRIAPTADLDDAEASSPTTSSSSFKNKHLRRSLSFVDEPSVVTDVIYTPNKTTRGGLRRSVTLASVAETDAASGGSETEFGSDSVSEAETLLDPNVAADFHVLRLDLKLGAPGSASSASVSGALVSQLEKTSISNLLDERIDNAISHIDNLRVRVEDTSSKVLVTGDLNAGKSTFVNALLGREVMPVDQQPCTTLFCEVHDSNRENDGVEELHVIRDGMIYDRSDDTTFDRLPIEELERLVAEGEDQKLSKVPVKLYVSDPRETSQSLLNNGIVDISLIDAPGLNRDSLQTTALFARQSEIDVVVFVVSAENHFTLSAKEFLWNASNEKAYLFIVVNRFDQIRDKAKCRRVILEQVRQLSSRTFDDKEDLVHFVDSSSALAQSLLKNGKAASSPELKSDPAFAKMESDLRSFVLDKRIKSKLLPVSTYLGHVLSDVELLSSSNAIVAQSELATARQTLENARPILTKMQKGREGLEEGLEEEEDSTTREACDKSKARLEAALGRVGKGEIGVTPTDLLPQPSPVSKVTASSIPTLPSYPGLLGVWDYTRDVRLALLQSLDVAVKLAEDEARVLTAQGVKAIADLGEVHLPQGVERSKRVFMPEAMFVPRLASSKGKSGRRLSTIPAPGRAQGLGLGLLANHPDLTEVTFVDILDLNHHVFARFGDLAPYSKSLDDDEDQSTASALSTFGIGLGAIAMVGGKAVGARGVLEGVFRLTELFGDEGKRKWIAPIVGVATLGMTVYFVLELPYMIPRTVGRRIKAELASRPLGSLGSSSPSPLSTVTSSSTTSTKSINATSTTSRLSPSSAFADLPFAAAHSARITRETRKVLRLASWDLRERFRAAMDEKTNEVVGAEEAEKRASQALEWFEGVVGRTEGVRALAELKIPAC